MFQKPNNKAPTPTKKKTNISSQKKSELGFKKVSEQASEQMPKLVSQDWIDKPEWITVLAEKLIEAFDLRDEQDLEWATNEQEWRCEGICMTFKPKELEPETDKKIHRIGEDLYRLKQKNKLNNAMCLRASRSTMLEKVFIMFSCEADRQQLIDSIKTYLNPQSNVPQHSRPG